MSISLINVGFGNIASADRIVAIVSPETASAKRMIQDARETGKVVDVSRGRKTRAAVIMDSGHVMLSALQPETIAGRVIGKQKDDDQ